MSEIIKLENSTNQVQKYNPLDEALSPQMILKQVALIQDIMSSVMKDGEHFGKIPGCGNKPTLLKAGAEKLCFTFRLRPEFEVSERELQNGHREYKTICRLFSMANGNPMGEGLGICTTLEGKFRFRTGEVKATDKDVPKDYWDLRNSNPARAQEAIGGKGFSVKKINNEWKIVIQGERIEHDNPADYYNTAIKMSKKRAFVDATITATAASDIFTQDIEDLKENGLIEEVKFVEVKESPNPKVNTIETELQNIGAVPVAEKKLKPPKPIEDLYKKMDAEDKPDNSGSDFETIKKLLNSGKTWNNKEYWSKTAKGMKAIYIAGKPYNVTEQELDWLKNALNGQEEEKKLAAIDSPDNEVPF